MPTTTPGTNALDNKFNTPLFLILIAGGLAGNYFKYPIFLNIDFLFGSIFAMLALQFFGSGRGITGGERYRQCPGRPTVFYQF